MTHETKHTPQPWTVKGPLKRPARWAVEAGAWTFYAGGQHGEANARLIAAAPELLAVCREVQSLIDEYEGDDSGTRTWAEVFFDSGIGNRLVGAVLRAEGRTP